MSNEKENVLKILPEYFEEVADGFKRAEVRYNDRDFKIGDIYSLCEWDGEKFTGRSITIRITHVLHGAGFKGLAPNYCMFSFVTKKEDVEQAAQTERLAILNRALGQSKEALSRAKDEICLRNAKISEQETAIRVLGELVGRR